MNVNNISVVVTDLTFDDTLVVLQRWSQEGINIDAPHLTNRSEDYYLVGAGQEQRALELARGCVSNGRNVALTPALLLTGDDVPGFLAQVLGAALTADIDIWAGFGSHRGFVLVGDDLDGLQEVLQS